MRLLIVNLHLDIGGVETLLVRLIPQLHARGFQITLLLLQNRVNAEFLTALSPYVTIKHIADAPLRRAGLREFFGGEFDLAFYTISQALIVGSFLLNRAGYNKTRVALGAYQTEIFCPEFRFWQYHRKIVQKIVSKDVPAFSMIFCNSAGRDFHAQRLSIVLEKSTVIRLFVDVKRYTYVERQNMPRRTIVSVGRVTEYKTYNFTYLAEVERLIAAGFDIEWHIYGDGEQLEQLRNEVRKRALGDRVFVHGALEYSRFEEVLRDSFLFVGSGTSLIEAAACGVPALTTVEYAPTALSYGFISEIDGFNMIEPGLALPTSPLGERTRELIGYSPERYLALQRACYEKAVSFSSTSIVDEYASVFKLVAAEGATVKISAWQMGLYVLTAGINHTIKKLLNRNQ